MGTWRFDTLRPSTRHWLVYSPRVFARPSRRVVGVILAALTHGLRREVLADIRELRTELKGDIAGLRIELKGDVAELRVEMREIRSDLTRVARATGGSAIPDGKIDRPAPR